MRGKTLLCKHVSGVHGFEPNGECPTLSESSWGVLDASLEEEEDEALTGQNDLTKISLTGGSSPYGTQDPYGVSLTGSSSPNGAQLPHQGQPPPEVPALTGHENSYGFSLTEAYPRLNASLPHRAYAVTRLTWPSQQSSSPQYPGQNGLPSVQRVKASSETGKLANCAASHGAVGIEEGVLSIVVAFEAVQE
ncbi:hypothetical protein BC835DRAFT_1304212 [Cytidiella melzeri]|nr:hypothetical protein BC835DRAFT_1304212 [Cytidiella melzeri]